MPPPRIVELQQGAPGHPRRSRVLQGPEQGRRKLRRSSKTTSSSVAAQKRFITNQEEEKRVNARFDETGELVLRSSRGCGQRAAELYIGGRPLSREKQIKNWKRER
jgi:hypothetical protein